MTELRNQLSAMGLDTRFALDIASVAFEIRPRGLMHVVRHLKEDLQCLLGDIGLAVIASRPLFGRKDLSSREGLLTDEPGKNEDADWVEIWFASKQLVSVEPTKLFKNPGFYLGYPECCCRAMQKEQALASLYERYLQSDTPRYWKLNRLAAIFHPIILMPDFFPCSLACKAALKFVEPFTQLASQVFSQEEVNAAKAAMHAPLTIVADEIVHWPMWTLKGGSLYLQSSQAKKERMNTVSAKLETMEPNQCALVMFDHFLEAGWDNGSDLVLLDGNDEEAMRLIPVIR